jgi:hypothetical protein
VLRSVKSEPSRNPSFLKCILRFQGPRKQEKHNPVEAASSLACAIDAFIGLHGQNSFQKKLGFGLGPDLTIIGSLNLNMMLKIEFSQINVAYGLTKDIKGYHIHIWSSSNSFIDKSNDGYTVSLIVY